MGYMTIKFVPKKRIRGHHTICETHGINKRICKKTPHTIKSATTIPDYIWDGAWVDKTVFAL